MRLLAASAAGFLGAQIRVNSVPVQAAQNDVVRANRFELIGRSGKAVAYWGSQDGQNASVRFLDEAGAEVAVLGLLAPHVPGLDLKGPDSRTRLTLRLEGEDANPILAMSDAKWEGRVLLGFVRPDHPDASWDQWALMLRAPGKEIPVASMGMTRDPVSGRISTNVRLLGEDGKFWVAPALHP